MSSRLKQKKSKRADLELHLQYIKTAIIFPSFLYASNFGIEVSLVLCVLSVDKLNVY